MRLDRFRALGAAFVATALAAGALAACGSDDDEAQELTITRSAQGDYQVPTEAESGLAEMTFTNRDDSPADFQLIRAQGDRSPEQVINAFVSLVESQEGAFPEWLFATGGSGTTAPGQSRAVSQVLEPGTYYLFDIESDGRPTPEDVGPIEVTGEESDAELPETDATVTAIDYGFETEGELKAGSNEITFANTGAQPHHILASPINGDATAQEVQEFLSSNEQPQGPPPVSQRGSDGTAVLEGGDSQTVTLRFQKPGRYALYCFITDRQGGPPHVIKGMVDEVEVK